MNKTATMTELSLEFLAQQASKESPFPPDAEQCRLSGQYLMPFRSEIFEELLQLRKNLDATLASKYADYPIGYCKEINDGMFELLKNQLNSTTTPGLTAIYAFCAAGGIVKKVWGNLRNCYFQNAMQMGSLYVDVSNDTVVITKPKLEILPIAKADFHPLEDYSRYAHIAGNYWQTKAYPNRHLPQLAPMFPLLLRYPSGQWKLHCPYQSLLYKNLLLNFQPAETFLLASQFSALTIPDNYLTELKKQIRTVGIPDEHYSSCPLNDDALRHPFNQARSNNSQLNAAICQQWLNQATAFNAAPIKTSQPA